MCLTSLTGNLPRQLQLSGTYVSLRMIRKILLGAAGGNSMDWAELTLADVRAMCPDGGHFLDALPPKWTAEDMQTFFECSPLLLSMWACLWKEPADAWPAAALLHACKTSALQAHVDAYKAQYAIAPCPYMLLKGMDPFSTMTKGTKDRSSRVMRRPSSS